MHVERIGLRFARVFTIAVAILSGGFAQAGNGGFRDGNFDFCVSVRFPATPTQLDRIRESFENASQVLADATDGQHRFRRVTIVNDGGASQAAEYWIHPGGGRAEASNGKYGTRGEHVNLFFDSDMQEVNGADGDAYTIVHEHAHHAYGVLDEYSGPGGEAECAPPPDSTSLTYSLMDNFFVRGGRAVSDTYTANEFCVATNHDPDADTFQEAINGRSAWETIASHPSRGAVAPVGLPADAPPSPHDVTFREAGNDLPVVLVIDNSGSMAEERRLEFAQRGAKVFTQLLQGGEGVGITSFNFSANVGFPLTTITSQGTRDAANVAIEGLSAGGGTNIGDGLLTAVGQITSRTQRSCNEIVVLLSDGEQTFGTPPEAALPTLQEEGVTVLTVGVGSSIPPVGESALQRVASATGGKFFRVAESEDLVRLYLALVLESQGNGQLTRAPLDMVAGETREVPALVELGASSATFALAIVEPADDLTFSLRSPSGASITEAVAATVTGVELIADENSKVYRITSPEAGEWTAIVTAASVVSGKVDVLAFAKHDGVQLGIAVRNPEVSRLGAVEVEATPRFAGFTVVGAKVLGSVVRPDGSTVPVELLDDGSAENGDHVAGDGVYSARFSDYTDNGTYTFELEVENATGSVVPGEEIYAHAPPNTMTVPPFQRRASATVVVTGPPGLPAAQDTTLRLRSRSTNEGANSLLVVGGSPILLGGITLDPVAVLQGIVPDLLIGPPQGDTSLVEFDLDDVARDRVRRATLVLTIDPRAGSRDWGRAGGAVAVHRLTAEWAEGDGRDLGLPAALRRKGSGPGATWSCAEDTDIANASVDCVFPWKGGAIAPIASASVQHVNGMSGKVRWDVTDDVLAGASGWLARRVGGRGTVDYVSREGAAEAGDLERGPLLVLEVE